VALLGFNFGAAFLRQVVEADADADLLEERGGRLAAGEDFL